MNADKLSHLQLTEVEKKSTKDILEKSEAYFVPTCNILCQTKTAWGCKKVLPSKVESLV